MKQQLKKFVLADVEKFEEVGGKKIYPSEIGRAHV